MNKKILTAFLAVLLSITTLNMAKADTMPPTLAILDTAINSNLPIFKDKVIYEVCVMQWNSCPNKSNIMEGPGSANLPAQFISKNGFDHGTQMASVAIAANPNIKIVFIRIIGATATGLRQPSGEATVFNALDWVLKNKNKFNIQAVSMQQGHHNLGLINPGYCPKTPTTENKVNELINAGVAVFFPTGNTRDYSRIDWPACIPSSISIGATMPTGEVAIYSNFDSNLTDFFALGTTRAFNPDGTISNVAGTSVSVVTAAANWIAIKSFKPELTYNQIYDLISKTSIPTQNSRVSGGRLINLNGALNG